MEKMTTVEAAGVEDGDLESITGSATLQWRLEQATMTANRPHR